MFSKVRSTKVLTIVAILVVLSATAALAALPSVRTFQPGLSAGVTVDGDPAGVQTLAWDTTVPANNPPEGAFANADWAGFLCQVSGGSPNCSTGAITNPPNTKGPYGDLLLRFQCPATLGGNGTLYGLFIARPGEYITNDTTGANNWIKYGSGGTVGNNKLVDSSSTTNWKYGTATGSGWQYAEWSGTLAPDAAPNQNRYTYSFNFHVEVAPVGTTAGTGDVTNVVMTCNYTTAVALSTFQAQDTSLTLNNMVLPGIAAFGGVLVLAGLVGVWYLGFRRA